MSDCSCTLCRKRAGLPVPEVVIEYEKPRERKRGEPCLCRHCEALRKEREELDAEIAKWAPSDAAAQFMFDGD